MRILLGLAAATLAALLVFALWPGVDLAVAHVFYDRGGFAGHDRLERFGRDFFRVAPFVALANLPDRIRGYGHVKDKAIREASAERARLLDKLRGPATPALRMAAE